MDLINVATLVMWLKWKPYWHKGQMSILPTTGA
jgi:hypothetical protein